MSRGHASREECPHLHTCVKGCEHDKTPVPMTHDTQCGEKQPRLVNNIVYLRFVEAKIGIFEVKYLQVTVNIKTRFVDFAKGICYYVRSMSLLHGTGCSGYDKRR